MNAPEGRRGWRTAPGWMKLLLVVSLALNLGVAGLIGGHALRAWHDDPFGTGKTEPGLDRRQTRLLHMVPEARRDDVKPILMRRQDDIDRAREGMREAQMALIEAIRADPLDPERLEAALARRREAAGAFWGIALEQVVEIVQTLNGAERAVLADRLEERTRRWMARHGHKEE